MGYHWTTNRNRRIQPFTPFDPAATACDEWKHATAIDKLRLMQTNNTLLGDSLARLRLHVSPSQAERWTRTPKRLRDYECHVYASLPARALVGTSTSDGEEEDDDDYDMQA